MSERLVPGYCALCRSRCGTLNEIIDGRLVGVRPDENHPTGGAVCLKGKAAPELIYSESRILWPLRRTQPKDAAEPGWVRISWEEALTEIAEKLLRFKREDGAESVAFGVTTPSGTPIIDSLEWIERFVRLYGSPNICNSTEICNWHKDAAHTFTFGCITPAADYSNAELIILWGHNPASTWLAQASAIGEGRRKGARLLVIDPCHTGLARNADVWLNIKPGTDVVLAMGFIRQMLQQGFNDNFVRTWTNAPLLVNERTGLLLRERDLFPDATTNHYLLWDKVEHAVSPCTDAVAGNEAFYQRAALSGQFMIHLADGSQARCLPALSMLQRSVSRYTPDYVESVTGVSTDKQEAALALICASSRIAYHAWVGIAQGRNATQTERAIAILYALTGAFDTRGSNRVYTRPAFNSVNLLSLLPESQRQKALGLKERPLGPPASGYITTSDLHRAVLEQTPYKIRGLVCFGSNMLSAHGNVNTAIAALKHLEFHVHCDHFINPTARFADILLPASTLWEHEALKIGFEISERAEAHIQLRPRLVTPRGEALADYEIVFRLACKMGMGEFFFNGDVDAGFNHMLQPSGLTVDDLRQKPGGITLEVDSHEKKYARHNGLMATPHGFATETGKAEVYSERLLRHGYSPVPEFNDEAQTQRAFPLRLTTMKNAFFCHSQHRSLVSLRKKSPDPVAIISQTLAENAGIGHKDWIDIITPAGSGRYRARIDKAIHDDVIIAEYGWWQGCPDLNKNESPVLGEKNSNYNALVNYESGDALSGSVPLRGLPCTLRKVADALAWKGERRFMVSRIHPETADVCSISFTPLEGAGPPHWQAGQAVVLRVFPENHPQGICRAYTLSNAPHDDAGLTVTVRHQPEGVMSTFLHQQLRTGDEVTLTAPDGNFVIPTQNVAPVIMVAGGIGITPFISYLRSLKPDNAGADLWLYYGNRNSRTHAFRKELQQLSQQLKRLKIVNIYDSPLPEDIPGEDYQYAGVITAALFEETVIRQRARFYLCGPVPMLNALEERLRQRGVFGFDIFREQFTPPVTRRLSGKASHQVVFARSGVTVQWTPEAGSLLELGEKNKIPMKGGCRVGHCECCKVKLLEGEVEPFDEVTAHDDNTCLACRAVPASNIVIDA